MASDQAALIRAFDKYGASVDAIAGKYVNPVTGKRLTGAALLAKLVKGESGNRGDRTSSAGAKGFAQFTAGSRAVAISKFGIDPWAGPDSAVHAAALHLRGHINGSTGLEGYNPGGGQAYVNYILGQHVGHIAGGDGHRTTSTGGPAAQESGFSPGAPQGALTAATQPVQPQIQSQGLQPTAIAAQAPMAKGYVPLPSSSVTGPPQPAEQPVAQGQTLPGVSSSGKSSSSSSAPPAQHGGVVLAPGTEANGKLRKPLIEFLSVVAGAAGHDLTVTTGTNHNKYVAGTRRVSDHFGGNAADLAVGGDARSSHEASVAGDKIAAHAIVAATGMSYQEALHVAREGGIHNFNVQGKRVQIIWKTNSGGNHFNHVHVGVA